jgi:YHS domain-containing protein
MDNAPHSNATLMKTITIDPVCGMGVEESSPHRTEHKGTLYLFCSDGCRQKFERDPERWGIHARVQQMRRYVRIHLRYPHEEELINRRS